MSTPTSSGSSPPTSPGAHAEQVRQDVLETLTETNLQEGSRNLLRNLVQKDLVLAYLTNAEVTEFRWKLREKKELFFAMHPRRDSEVTGQDRAAINDDPTDTLRPLSDQQRVIVHDFFDMLETRVTRAREMRQQEMMNTSIEEVTRQDKTSSDSGGNGILGRFR